MQTNTKIKHRTPTNNRGYIKLLSREGPDQTGSALFAKICQYLLKGYSIQRVDLSTTIVY